MTAVYVPCYLHYRDVCDIDIKNPGVFVNEKDAVHALLKILCEHENIMETFDDEEREPFTYDSLVESLVKKGIQMETEEDLKQFVEENDDSYYNDGWTFSIKKHMLS